MQSLLLTRHQANSLKCPSFKYNKINVKRVYRWFYLVWSINAVALLLYNVENFAKNLLKMASTQGLNLPIKLSLLNKVIKYKKHYILVQEIFMFIDNKLRLQMTFQFMRSPYPLHWSCSIRWPEATLVWIHLSSWSSLWIVGARLQLFPL